MSYMVATTDCTILIISIMT